MLKFYIVAGIVLGFLAVFYYFMVAFQCFGLLKFTKKEITFPKALIPFYCFFI